MTEAIVYVVDNDDAVRSGVKAVVESMGIRVKDYESAATFLQAYDAKIPACLILDVKMPKMSGLELQRRLAEHHVSLPIIFITGHGNVATAVEALQMGAMDFLEKPFRNQVLREKVQRALDLVQRNQQRLSDLTGVKSRLESLTARERQIADLLLTGKMTKAIAYQLSISPKTADFHRANILTKMSVESTVELVLLLKEYHHSIGTVS